MVAFDIAKIAKILTKGAKTAFTALKENPVEGSIFDAAKKLGINNKGDLKAGIEMLKGMHYYTLQGGRPLAGA